MDPFTAQEIPLKFFNPVISSLVVFIVSGRVTGNSAACNPHTDIDISLTMSLNMSLFD